MKFLFFVVISIFIIPPVTSYSQGTIITGSVVDTDSTLRWVSILYPTEFPSNTIKSCMGELEPDGQHYTISCELDHPALISVVFYPTGSEKGYRKDMWVTPDGNVFRHEGSLKNITSTNPEDAVFRKWNNEMKELDFSKRWSYLNDNIGSYPNSFIGLHFINRSLSERNLSDDPAVSFSKLSPEVRESPQGKMVWDRIRTVFELREGSVAPDFTLLTREGNEVSLSDFRGKYVLIDFWASWCHYCREANPTLSALYEQYRDKGFEILGVSFDTSNDHWLKALDEDKTAWTHVVDLNGTKGTIGKRYDIGGLPHMMLIDLDGIILYTNIRDNKLGDALKEIMR